MFVYMSTSLFLLLFSRKMQSGIRTFHDICCSKPVTFHNGFMFFCFPQLVQALLQLYKPSLVCKRGVAVKLQKVLAPATRSKTHETIVEGHRLQTAYIYKYIYTPQHWDSAAHDSTPQRNPLLLLSFSLLSFSLLSYPPCQKNYQNYFRKILPRNRIRGSFPRTRYEVQDVGW